MKKQALTELEGSQTTAASALAQMIRLHQITCGHLATDDGEVRPLKNNRINELLIYIGGGRWKGYYLGGIPS